MGILIGHKTIITVKTLNSLKHIIEQDWWLHSTKGWKRGAKRKKIVQASWNDYPRNYTTVRWSG